MYWSASIPRPRRYAGALRMPCSGHERRVGGRGNSRVSGPRSSAGRLWAAVSYYRRCVVVAAITALAVIGRLLWVLVEILKG